MEPGSRRSLRLVGRIAFATDETEVECCGFDPSKVCCWPCPCVGCRRCEEEDDPFPVCQNGILHRFHTFPFASDPDFSSKMAISHYPFSPKHTQTPLINSSSPPPFSAHPQFNNNKKYKKKKLSPLLFFCWVCMKSCVFYGSL